jgi:predicted MFS family arabinose efflux permease
MTSTVTASAQTQSPTYLSGFLAVRVFLAFASGYFLSYALRAVNAAIAPLLANDLNLSNSALGWFSSAYFLAFGVMQIPVGIWLDRHGARRTEAALLLVAALGSLLIAVGQSLWILFLGRILIGIGVSACLMASYSYFRRCYLPEQQARLVMCMLVAGTGGALIAAQPALLLAEALGWRHVFSIASVGLLISACLVFFLTGDYDRQTSAQTGTAADSDSFFSLCRHPIMLRAIPASILIIGGFVALQTLWVGPWLTQALSMTAEQASQILLYLNATILASYLAMGVLSPWLVKRGASLFKQSSLGLLWLTLCFTALPLWQAESAWLLWPLIALAVPAMFLLQTQTALEFPSHIAGRVLTTLNLMIFAGTFIVQWGLGVLTDGFVASGFDRTQALTYALGVLAAMQWCSLLWFWRKTPHGSIGT